MTWDQLREEIKQRSPYTLGLLSGLLGVLAIRVPFLWPVMFVAFIPLLYGSQKTSSVLKSGGAGILAGVLICGAGSWWFFDTLPFPLTYGIQSPVAQFFLVAASWLIVISVTGVWVGVWSALLTWMRLNHVWKYALAIFLFLFSNLVSLFAYNVVTAGSGIHNPAFYSAGFVGYVLADNEAFLQAALFGGIWMLTALVLFVNIGLYCLFCSKRYRTTYICIGLLFCVGLTPLGSLLSLLDSHSTETVPVGFVSLGIAARDLSLDTAQRTNLLLESVTDLEEAGAQIILLPEDDRVFSPTAERTTASILKDSSIAIIHSGSIPVSNGHAALGGYISVGENDTWLRNKIALVPQGEYLPYAVVWFMHSIGAGAATDHFSRTRALTNGEIGNTGVFGNVRVALMFCSELLTPNLARQMRDSGDANILLITSSHALFSGHGSVETDTLRFARVQTVEAGIPSVSSVTNGPGYALDRFGRITAYQEAQKNSVATGVTQVEIRK